MNRDDAKRYLEAFDFKRLFLDVMGWDNHAVTLQVLVEATSIRLEPVAHKRGMVVLLHTSPGGIPLYAIRRKIERQAARAHREHLIIYIDGQRREQVWQWVRQEPGQPLASREHYYDVGQPGDSLLQKLEAIAFSLDEEDTLTLVDVTSRVRSALDVERVTKRFYDQFRRERDAFEDFLKGIPDADMARWYVSVMLNRLMFIYFIQKKGFLNGDPDYLGTKLFESRFRGQDRYYRDFLCPLFFRGFALPLHQRPPEVQALLGTVPYLNGGIFQHHEVEERCGQAVQVPDAAFERLFGFFDQYQWHLDDRPLRQDNEINPDVLGYIFEKYVNQKQMGAYYTKEDITGYISRNTVIPFLFDAARKHCGRPFKKEGAVWRLLREDPDRYIYPAVKHGFIAVDGSLIPLPPEIAVGVSDVCQRMRWNTPTDQGFALPTEIWRETVARRQRYEEVRGKLAAGEVHDINDLITYNLDIEQFAQDVIESCDDPDLLRAFWKAIRRLSCLDPTCGSGAFLFAALNVLEPLYEAYLDRMQVFLDEVEAGASPQKYSDFREVLAQIDRHPSRKYYVFKSIVVDNLYGVDIMAEAVEIARLRLFLKLVAQVEDVARIEPLPDIDFNIQAGNTLVGFTTREQVQAALRTEQQGHDVSQTRMLFEEDEARLRQIEERAGDVDRLYRRFRDMQMAYDMSTDGENMAQAKAELRKRLTALEEDLNRALARQYGIDPGQPKAYERWLASHQPFHWFVEFYGIMQAGGVDVIIGNPPYVVLSSALGYHVRGLATLDCRDLFGLVMERSAQILNEDGHFGMIVPVSSVSTDGFAELRDCLRSKLISSWISNYAERPSKLFVGAEKRLTIWIGNRAAPSRSRPLYVSTYRRWLSEERCTLFARTRYTQGDGSTCLVGSALPKIGTELEAEILQRLTTRRPLDYYLVKNEDSQIYYTRQVRYFAQFFDFIPRIVDAHDQVLLPSELKTLSFRIEGTKQAALALLNSSLFFWFLSVHSDVRNLNRRDIGCFRCSLDEMDTESVRILGILAGQLMESFRSNSRIICSNYRDFGLLHIQSFQPRLSKPIIDEIDHVLAQYYGLTDEELDFIINYDIKYRMGDELQGAEDE